MKNLFNEECEDEPQHRRLRADHAHAATPGNGPQGETCGTCLHCSDVCYNTKTYFKCGKLRAHWTHGPGTDIRKKDPACIFWTKLLGGKRN
jgi:hypothetical protein